RPAHAARCRESVHRCARCLQRCTRPAGAGRRRAARLDLQLPRAMRIRYELLAALTASIAIASAVGCGSKADADTTAAPSGARKNDSSITVSSEQRERIGVFVV